MMNENTLQETIQHTTTDVINQLHHLKGMDRYYLLMEHFETLIFNWEDYEVDWIEQIKLKEKPVIKQSIFLRLTNSSTTASSTTLS